MCHILLIETRQCSLILTTSDQSGGVSSKSSVCVVCVRVVMNVSMFENSISRNLIY